ncbi:MAG: Gfo/Idh/MocA family oxidoreductase [Chitinophagaceae bacterium]|jgi:predicted dehydrogenase|nr:Gfo/Idh/MocA family oxidoreductase [Chitinophagaceae bacterium]
MKKVKWGIISTAKIGVEKVIPGMMKCENAEVIAISSRNLENAQKAAVKLGIKKAYGSYEALLEDTEVEAVYNPLPNHLHVPWTIKALQAGKHVLCEKPIALNASEAALLLETSAAFPHLKLMEAFMYRHTPQWKFAKQKIADGSIGQLRNIHSLFSYYNADPNNIRNKSDIGGGGLMDIGCYCISLSRWLFGQEPARVSAVMEPDPVMMTDRLASGILDFSTGTALFTCSTQMMPFQRATILGTEGAIEIEIPFNAPPDKPTRLWMYTKKGREEVVFEAVDQYTLQGESFSRSILEDTPVYTPIEDAIGNMKVMDAFRASAGNNQWVAL